MPTEIKRFALIVSGRVASAIAPALVASGMKCMAVYSPTYSHASRISKRLHCGVASSLADVIEQSRAGNVDFVLLSIKDDAISEVATAFSEDFASVVLHTSGATSIDALSPIPHRGVLYPMQTFSPDRVLDLEHVPIFPEASDPLVAETIGAITQALGSRRIHYLTSDERAQLHLASVFACNFVNHLYALSDDIMRELGLTFTDLAPLVEETLNKALQNTPQEVQTGPAIRNDRKTIQRHLSLLAGDPKVIYQTISESIINHRKV